MKPLIPTITIACTVLSCGNDRLLKTLRPLLMECLYCDEKENVLEQLYCAPNLDRKKFIYREV